MPDQISVELFTIEGFSLEKITNSKSEMIKLKT